MLIGYLRYILSNDTPPRRGELVPVSVGPFTYSEPRGILGVVWPLPNVVTHVRAAVESS